MNASGSYSNTATISGNQSDPSSGNNTSTVTPGANDLPIANKDVVTTNEDTPLSITVATNDHLSNDGGNVFNIACVLCSSTAHGSLTFNSNGTYTYTPNANYNGTDQFVYQLCDANNDCDTAIVYITINPVNDLPIANWDAASTNEDTPVNGTVTANDVVSGDGGNVWTLVTAPTHGTVTVNADGTYTYTPNANYNGPDSFIYKLCDVDNDCDTAIVRLTINSVNDLPVAVNDVKTTNEDTPVSGTVISNDTPSGDGGNVWTLVGANGGATHGSITMSPNGSYTYTPDPNYNGTDVFTYQVCDVTPDCSTATVTITINPINDSPIANWDSTSTNENISVNGTLTSNDVLSGDGGNVWALVSSATHGSVTVNTNGIYTYTPNSNYNGPDNFIYTLCDVDNDCDTAIVFINIISINHPPIAVVDIKTTTENIPVSGTVTANDSDPDGNLNPNGYTLVTSPTHGTLVFNNDGSYTYTPNTNYIGTDNFIYQVCDLGMPIICDTAIVYITIKDCKPTAAFTYNKLCNGLVEFNNTSTNATDYEWIFGNGSFCTNSPATFTREFYAGNGNVAHTYTVTLIARNNGRCSDTVTQTFTIEPNAIAVFNYNALGCSKTVKFNNLSVNGSTYEWDFGVLPLGTAVSSATSPSYTYAANGTYSVRLITKNSEGCADTLIKSVVVNSNGISPTASFGYTVNAGSCVTRYTFYSTSTNAVSYQWIFSDGSVVNQASISHSFATAGDYIVKLVAKSSTNCYDTATQTIHVAGNSSGAIAGFTINNQKQCLAGNSFDFINTSTFAGVGYNASYEWDFGDGTTNNVNYFIYNKKYANPGLYSVKLTAVGNNGCRDSYYSTIEVLASPKADFTVTTSCGMTATITNHTTNAIANIWSYGDGGFEENNTSAFTHHYTTQNWFFIKLYAIGANGCIDSTDNGLNTTKAHAPVISLTYDTVACNNAIRFMNTTLGGSEFVWDFGDGSPLGHNYYATHAYSVAGNYLVTLTASNGSSCVSTYSFIVRAPQGWDVALPKAHYEYTVSGCSNDVLATSSSINATSLAWYYDGVLLGNSSTQAINNAAVGVHNLQLISYSGACSDTFTQVIIIQDAPTGNFNYNTSTCSKTVTFASNTNNANSFKWNFGDVTSASDSAIGSIASHTFSANGTYAVTLSVTNIAGCTYNVIDNITVNGGNNPLDAAFNFVNTNCDCYCSNKIKFDNITTGNANTYLWNFGDGNTSTQKSPNKGYAATGNYNVSLTVTDATGCISTTSAQVFVPAVAKGPSASFSTDNTSQCLSNNNFNFYNHSRYMGAGWINKYYWDYGDGTFDTTNTFVYNKRYSSIGKYTVRLIAVGNEDCRDTMMITVQVKSGSCIGTGVILQMFNPTIDKGLAAQSSDASTGIEKATVTENNWSLYPNPNTGAFTISSKNISGINTIEVIDILGRTIDVDITKNMSKNNIDFRLNEVREGYYFVIIKNESGENTKLKFNITY